MIALVGRIVALIGGVMIFLRRWGTKDAAPAMGLAPAIPLAKPQGIPTLKMPTARGWVGDHKPTPAAGLKVNAFATGLDHPRWIEVLPNGDVLTAEAIARDGLTLAGWVANLVDPHTSRLHDNLATLAERLPAPCLGYVPRLEQATPAAVSDYLNLDILDLAL